MTDSIVISKICNLAGVLRDDGVGYGDCLEEVFQGSKIWLSRPLRIYQIANIRNISLHLQEKRLAISFIKTFRQEVTKMVTKIEIIHLGFESIYQ
jgi:hypothetical protein